MELTTQERQAILDNVAAVMPEHTATFANLDRPEYGTVTVDMGLLRKQIDWLGGLGWGLCDEQEGLLNLLGAMRDLTDLPEEDEGEADD